MSGDPSGFSYKHRKNGDVVISHHGRVATTLRGDTAAEFIEDMNEASPLDAQDIMARLTGNYRRGNERLAKDHPRNV
ncbi:hypothetical protein SAMN05444287_2918 [Octadecabacter temperatus]|uniref:Uncharacterized protein n=1 Tax=Octadecabacter temperatus TaxID=1458307 RepID=A0A0K0Y8Z5_9RHOB|nr:hypothetical protein [Octadecabacter temperatus]AKS47438.1 hypothetical protein OSB_29150 [Octadecabacter temperatus]SIO42695.1 hypothetical protein SAMN05444287_2918 [Octadecabacter temperatus]